ncbi:MAG: xanthine dehydrogenase small subunit [Myxococcota bacterium]|nr:xanthine dehydrogenase small subunit [Myxococcota bacterium]
MDPISFTLNGRPHRVEGLSPTTTLLRYLREHAQLMGTKEGCAEGDCGACSVVVLDEESHALRAVNSCILLLPSLNGKQLFTVEGIGDSAAPHPVQQAMVECLGSQCGYCTPGFVMTLFEACYRDDLDEPWKLDDQLAGNLCRCTGYRPIREAAERIAGRRPEDRFTAAIAENTPASAAAEAGAAAGADLVYEGAQRRFYAPTTLEALWAILSSEPEARLLAGGTDLGLEITRRFEHPSCLISLGEIKALRGIQEEGEGWLLGSMTRLAALESWAREAAPALERTLRFFGARQIKNSGTIGGNLCTASPIGDLPPTLIALGAEVIIAGERGTRRAPLEDFFTGYRETLLAEREILAGIWLPKRDQRWHSRSFKLSKRQELDISTVSAGMSVAIEDGVIVEARLAFGGMAAVPARARTAEVALQGQPFEEASFLRAAEALRGDFQPIDDHRGSAWYRQRSAENLIIGLWLELSEESPERLEYRPTGTVQLQYRSLERSAAAEERGARG